MRSTVKAALFLALAVGLINPSTNSLAQTTETSPPASAPPVATPPSTETTTELPVSHKSRHARKTPVIAPASPAPLIAAPTPPGARLSPGTPIPPAELEALVDGVVRQAMATDHIAGVSVSVVQNGQVLLKKGYGFARLAPASAVDPDRTLFRLGPVSHLFTWMVVMKEVEAGHIRPGTPINQYLPEALHVPDQHFKRTITLDDLMAHRAGFEDRRLGQLFEADPARIRPLVQYLQQERRRRVREAGTLSSPSDYETGLAGEAASYISGKPFQTLTETDIINPLGLKRTTFREPYPARADLPAPMPAALARDVSEGFHWTKGAYEPRPFAYASQIAPAEAASSTAGDMARYMLAILGSGQIDGVNLYSPATAAAFRTEPKTNDPALSGWASGFKAIPLPGHIAGWGQNGGGLSFSSSLVTVPALNLGVFVAVNTETGARLARGLPAEIVGRFYAPPIDLPLAASPGLADQRRVYAGVYLTAQRAHAGLEKFVDQLQGWVKVTVTRQGLLIVSGPNAPLRAYTPAGAAGQFRRLDDQAGLSFQIDKGRAQRILTAPGEGALERAHVLNHVTTLATLAVLTFLASLATLVSLITRNRRDFRQTTTQSRAGLLQTTIAVLWLLSMACFGLWTRGMSDMAKLMYHWPGLSLMLASVCALVASSLTLICIGLGPAVWRGGRRVDSWTSLRKWGFTLNMTVSAAFAVVLFAWGALQPWS